MNGSATHRSSCKMTRDNVMMRMSNGNSSSGEALAKTTLVCTNLSAVQAPLPHSSKSESKVNGSGTRTVAAHQSKTNGSDKAGGESRDHTKKLERRESMEMSHVHMVYSQMAPYLHGLQQKAWPKVKQFLKGLQPGSIVADIGCGSGRYLHINKSLYKLGSDICIPLVQYAKEKGHEVMVADNLKLPYRNNVFDAIVSIGVIHHFSTHERRVQAFKELTRVLAPGGRLLACVWAFEQKHRRFESQDVLIPWHKPPKTDLQRVRGSCSDFERSSTSSVSDDDTSPMSSSHSVNSIPELLKTHNKEENLTFTLHNGAKNRSLVQECQRVEACIKRLLLKSHDHNEVVTHTDDDDADVKHDECCSQSQSYNYKSSGLSIKSSVTDCTGTVCGEDSLLAVHSSSYKPCSEGNGKVQGLRWNLFDKPQMLRSDVQHVPASLSWGPKHFGVGHCSSQDCKKQPLRSQSQTCDTSHSEKNSNLPRTGMLEKVKNTFQSLFLSHNEKEYRSVKTFDEIVHDDYNDIICGDFPQGFEVREFPQSSLAGGGFSLPRKQSATTESLNKSPGQRSLSLTNIPCFIDKKEARRHHRKQVSNSQEELKSVTSRTEDSPCKCFEDDVFAGDGSSSQSEQKQNGVQSCHRRSCPSILADEKKEFVTNGVEKKAVGDNLKEMSFFNSELCRYYHVFKEGELKKLVSDNIDDLIIVDTYFDHSNWCLIAEKCGNT